MGTSRERIARNSSEYQKDTESAKKLGLSRFTGNLQQAQDQVTKAIQTRKRCKSKAQSLQEEYRLSLAVAKEAEDNIPAATHIRNLTHQEHTR